MALAWATILGQTGTALVHPSGFALDADGVFSRLAILFIQDLASMSHDWSAKA